MRLLAAAATVALALAAAGCGAESGGENNSGSAVAPLLDRVPGEAMQIIAMDMAAAKRELGVAADLDPERYGERQVSYTPEERLDTAALQVVDYLVVTSPFATAIDHGLISAGVKATLIPGGPLTILKTSQPRTEIARGLGRAGLRRSGAGGFVLKKGKDSFGLSAVALGDGLVVLAETLDVASAVLRRTEPDPGLAPTRRLLDATRGALRTVQRYPAESLHPESACLLGVAGGQIFTSGNEDEDLALLLRGEPRASEVTLGEGSQQRDDPLTQPYRVTDVARSGRTLSLKVHTTPDARNQLSAAQIAGGHVPPYLVYHCPGAAAQRARRKLESTREILPPSPEPDRSGSRLETLISNYVAKLSTAPNAVRVRCPVQTLPAGTRRLRCSGTRAHQGKTFHYTLRVVFAPNASIKYIDLDSRDDTTDTIVSPPSKKRPPGDPEPAGDA